MNPPESASPAAATPRGDRIEFLDAARGVLMTLGIFLHGAAVYAVGFRWLISDPHGSVVFDRIDEAIHLFRMPAFFVISGFFAMLTLDRYGPALFYRKRMLRIGVPLVFTGITLNSVQTVVVHWSEGGVRAGLAVLSSGAYWRDGQWIAHLWFLINVVLYSTVVYAAARAPAASRMLARVPPALDGLAARPRGRTLVLGIALPLLSMLPALATSRVPSLGDPVFGLFTPETLVWYGGYFAFGAVLFRSPRLLAGFATARPWLVVATPLVALAWRLLPHRGDWITRTAADCINCYASWILCSWVFVVFRAQFDRHSTIFRRLADASYSIYLLHHLGVVVLGLALSRTAMPLAAKYVILVTVVFGATWLAHELVVRPSDLLSRLLNGRQTPAPRATRSPGSGRPAAEGACPSPAPRLAGALRRHARRVEERTPE